MKKKDANYKIIMGMHAVGNQCRDCDNSDTSSTICLVVDGKVKPTGSCNQFSKHYDDEPVKVKSDKRGMEINREFHEALGLKAGGVR